MTGGARDRLDRLEGYLREDPQNAQLLAETFDEALRAAAFDRAEFHLRHALALGLDRPAWLRREAHWLLAQHRWDEARAQLLSLQTLLPATGANAASIAADLAYVDLRIGDVAAGVARLESVAETDPADPGRDPALAPVWLRLLHRGADLERAMRWLTRAEAGLPLDPVTAGVASLIALDHGDYASSLRWSTQSLRDSPSPPVEAQVARASLALAERKPAMARDLLQAAMARNAGDGRVWSAVGFTELLDGALPAARDAFERAVVLMPDHIGTWHGLGWTALAQRDLPGARRAFDAALDLDRNFAESHGGAAVVSAVEGDAARARAAIDVALRLDRRSLSARYAEALLAGDARDTESVLRLADRLLGGQRSPLGADLIDLLRNARPGTGRPT